MTNWIINTFIPNKDQLEDPKVRTRYGNVASTVGILCNLLLVATKMVAGFLSGSVSIIADATNNLSDSVSSIVSLIGFKLSSRKPDKDHPYGHGRYEYLAGLFVSVLIMVVGIEIFRSSLDKILNPTPVDYSAVTLGILVFSILVKFWLMGFYTKIGKLINSNTIIATAADSRNDVLTTGAVLIAAIITKFTGVNLDGWMGIIVATFVIYSGFSLIRETVNPILGPAPAEDLVASVQAKIMSYPGVLGTHDLRIHDYGPTRRYGSVDVELDAHLDGLEAHEITDQIERDIHLQDGILLTVHYDPVLLEADPDLVDPEKYPEQEVTAARHAALRQWLQDEVKHIDPELSVHDVRLNPEKDGAELYFDCVRPENFAMSDDELIFKIRERVRRINPSYRCVIRVETFAPADLDVEE